jgi:hypothetical protein
MTTVVLLLFVLLPVAFTTLTLHRRALESLLRAKRRQERVSIEQTALARKTRDRESRGDCR